MYTRASDGVVLNCLIAFRLQVRRRFKSNTADCTIMSVGMNVDKFLPTCLYNEFKAIHYTVGRYASRYVKLLCVRAWLRRLARGNNLDGRRHREVEDTITLLLCNG